MPGLPDRNDKDRERRTLWSGLFLIFQRIHPIYFVMGVVHYRAEFLRLRWYGEDCKQTYLFLRGYYDRRDD